MKRKGETFTEFLVAVAVFGIIMAGVFEFMANQTEAIVSIRDKDELMHHANRYVILSRDVKGPTIDKKAGIGFASDGEILIVSNDRTSLSFKLKP